MSRLSGRGVGGAPWVRLTVESVSSTDGGWGDSPVESWEAVRDERFQLLPMTGKEYERSDQMVDQLVIRGRCHYFAGANSTMRLVGHDRTFNVVSVWNDSEKNRWLIWDLIEVFDA